MCTRYDMLKRSRLGTCGNTCHFPTRHVGAMSSSATSPVESSGSRDDVGEWVATSNASDHDAGTRFSHCHVYRGVEACASPGKDVGFLEVCEFDCGPPMPQRDMVNKGSSRSQRWVRRPCLFATRALIRAWIATAESKAVLDEVRSK